MLEALIRQFLKNREKLKRIWDVFVLAVIVFVVIIHYQGVYFCSKDTDEEEQVAVSNTEENCESNEVSEEKGPEDNLPQIIYHEGYTTCCAKLPVTGVSKSPVLLEFDCPDTWTIVCDEVTPEEDIYEIIKLCNNRGIEIYYVYFNPYPFSFGDKKSPFFVEWKSTELSGTEFAILPDSSDEETFIVSKLVLGDVWRIGLEEPWSSGGEISYAVLPKDSGTDIGDRPIVCNSDIKGLDCSMCIIPVDLDQQQVGLAFYSSSPDGTYTADERAEVISILKSIRRNIKGG